jgi:hypothetical protein
MFVIDCGQGGLDLLFGGLLMRTKVIHETDAGVGDIESTMRDARELYRSGEQIKQLLGDLHRMLGRFGVDLRYFTG